MSEHSLHCYVEAPTPQTLNLKAALHATFYEVGGVDPVNIIRCDQKAIVKVRIDFTGCDLARLLCIEWCIKLAFEGCGTAKEGSLKPVRIPQTVCKDPFVEAEIEIPANYFDCEAADCGNLYQLCLTVMAFDTCGKPAPFAGYCKGGTIMVFPAGS